MSKAIHAEVMENGPVFVRYSLPQKIKGDENTLRLIGDSTGAVLRTTWEVNPPFIQLLVDYL